ncbi:MAG: zinc-binding dehydrogenase [Ferrovibrio sp.]|uniref:zinc-binding dehydrogenase n=1 Tax=Ferrovibrio sp. TaxID=1917215 RepID=UPI0026124EBD|nr:zinc-binding dehydrogenase [Ferrovibrio sp.]MCW0235009.1 zinc-binding dehydrogenase [Ferrovibrio sp.]
MMQAIVLRDRKGGSGAVYGSFERPQPQPGDVLVRLRAASVNRVDVYMRRSGAGITHALPQIMGVDGAGEVAEVHDPQSPLRPGQRVVIYPALACGRCRYCLAGDQLLCLYVRYTGEHRHGTMAEYVSVPAVSVLPIPEGMDFHTAACLPVAYLTAWRMLFCKAQLQPGETVVIIGVGGGVAIAALQLARLAGARAIVTSRHGTKLQHAGAMGATAVIKSLTEDAPRRVLDLTFGHGAEVVIDSVGGPGWGASLKMAARGGRIVTCGATAGSQPGADLQRVFIRQLQIFGSTLGSQEEFRQLLNAVAQGGLRPVIDRVYPLSEAVAALDYLESGEQFGKIVIDIPLAH